jgi:hypothetical protein
MRLKMRFAIFLLVVLYAILAFELCTRTTKAKTYSSFDKEETVISGASMAADAEYEIRVGPWDKAAISVTWSGADATDGDLKLQASVDGTNYEDYPNSTYTFDTASGTHWWNINTGALSKIKAVYAHDSNTTGTYLIYVRKEIQ